MGQESKAAEQELESIRKSLHKLLPLGADGEHLLGDRDAAEFKRLEAVTLLAHYLGKGNDFADAIKQTVGGGIQINFGLPKLARVRDVEAIVRGAIAHMQRFGVAPARRKSEPHVSDQGIAELRGIANAERGTARLVRLCEN
jgi:hypothetical protein